MKVSIDGTLYDLPEQYGGDFLPIVSQLDRPLEKIMTPKGPITVGTNEISEFLKDYLLFRVQALTFTTYKEYSWEDIRKVSYEVMELDEYPHFDYTPDPRLSKEERWMGVEVAKKASKAERVLYRKGKLEEAKAFLPTALQTITFEGLDWLNYFHEVTSKLDEDFLKSMNLFPILKEKLINLRTQYPKEEVQVYHLVPELIDWNFYLSVRGPAPKNYAYTKYSLILDYCYTLEKDRQEKEMMFSFLKANPEELPKILTYGCTDHPEVPKAKDIDPHKLYRLARNYYQETRPKMFRLPKETCKLFEKAYNLSKREGISREDALNLVLSK